MSQTYSELINEFPLRPIRSVRQAERADRIVTRLAVVPRLTRDEQDYLDVLSSLIEQFEASRYPIPDVESPRELLRWLMTENELTLSRLASDTGIRVSTLSEILSGKRDIGLPHIRKLCARFRCEPGLWIDQRQATAS